MRARSLELGLLIIASLVTCLAYVTVVVSRAEVGADLQLQAEVGGFMVMVLGLIVGAHIIVRTLAPLADGTLLPIAALLNGVGYVMIARLDEGLASSQSAWSFVGLAAFAATLLIFPEPKKLEAYRYSLALLGVALLMLPRVPGLGKELNGARIWIQVGPFSIQPGEFAKIVLAAFLAGYLVEKRELLVLASRKFGPIGIPDVKHFGPLVAASGVVVLIMMLLRDLGSALLFFTLLISMFYIATSRVAYVIAAFAVFASGAVLAWQRFSHVQRRVDIWLDPFADPKGAGFQLVEATFALADGGLTGTGLGAGTPGKVVYAHSDMIFAAIGEELGLLGATALLVCYLFLIAAGMRVAVNANSTFETLLAAGLTALIGFQTFIIVGGIVRVLPLTGVTLPFVSHGGSSLISNYIILAILIRISHNSVAQAADDKAERDSGGGFGVGAGVRSRWRAVTS